MDLHSLLDSAYHYFVFVDQNCYIRLQLAAAIIFWLLEGQRGSKNSSSGSIVAAHYNQTVADEVHSHFVSYSYLSVVLSFCVLSMLITKPYSPAIY